MYYSKINECDIANGLGVRVSIFVSGCTNHCEGCFQPETWDFKYGKKFTGNTIGFIVDLLKRPFIKGLSILGGEPLEPQNQKSVLELILAVRQEVPSKDIWCYSGFTLEQLLDVSSYAHTEYLLNILHNIDVLVDGKFILSKKNIGLKFRGSENQRLIDIKQTLLSNSIVQII